MDEDGCGFSSKFRFEFIFDDDDITYSGVCKLVYF